jgi:ribosomal protein S18 acetylase RimI-like enzyme
MNVRPAEPRDADTVLALMEGLTRPAIADDPKPQRDVFLAHLEREDALVFVAELDGEIAGAVSLWIQPRLNWTTPQAWIPDLYVDPRSGGAGRPALCWTRAPTRLAGGAATCSSSSPDISGRKLTGSTSRTGSTITRAHTQ